MRGLLCGNRIALAITYLLMLVAAFGLRLPISFECCCGDNGGSLSGGLQQRSASCCSSVSIACCGCCQPTNAAAAEFRDAEKRDCDQPDDSDKSEESDSECCGCSCSCVCGFSDFPVPAIAKYKLGPATVVAIGLFEIYSVKPMRLQLQTIDACPYSSLRLHSLFSVWLN